MPRYVPVAVLLGVVAAAAQQPAPTPAPQQPSEIELTISGDPGTPPRFAVPDFVALTPDAAEAAKTIGRVLWEDLNFEREFYLIPRDTYATIPAARSADQVPFDAWRELGADGVIFGTIASSGDTVRVEVRLFNVRSRQSVFAKEYSGSAANPRLYAHTISDEIHQQQRALRGVARTKLAFSSDRNREKLTGTVENRDTKEIYIADYDGANQRRITVNRQLNITPVWSPDARAIAYTSYRRGYPDVFVALIYQGTQETPTNNRGQNTTPTWSPSGTQIAFTSDRSGTPQIYVMNADGTGVRRLTTNESYADRPTWSPPPFNEIAYAGRTGPGYDIKVYEFASGQTRQITFGEGSNESPAYSPNGRHLAFVSTRGRGAQVYTIGRDGRGVRQITRDGNNYTPSWSQ
jgi:TolB protein